MFLNDPEVIDEMSDAYRERLVAYLRSHPITKQEFAKKLGISPITMMRFIEGETIKPSTLYKLELFFNRDAAEKGE